MLANLAVDKSPGDDKHKKSDYNDESTRSTPRQSSTSYQNRRPSVTFDLPPLSYHPGDDLPHQSQSEHRKRVSTHSKTSSIGSIGGQSITSSISSSVSSNSAAATPTSATSPARRQLRKKKRASTISSFTTVEERQAFSSVMRFGVKLDFNKRSSKRISQDSLSKELPPLPHEAREKRVSGRLPLPTFEVEGSGWHPSAQAALLSSPIHEEAVLHITKNEGRRSSMKSRTDLPPLPSKAAHTQQHRYVRQKQTALSSAQHLAEVKWQTELWLSMLCASDDEGDNLFTPSLSSSSSNSSLNGKSPTPSSDCCDPGFLVPQKPFLGALPELPLPYTSPILLPPFSDVVAHPLNPFEASFVANRNRHASSSEIVLPNRRRSSLPTHSLADSGADGQRRLDKHRPPPLSLAPIQDSPAEENTAVQTAIPPPPPPQYRSRSLSHDLRPLDPLSLYRRRFHRSSQDTTDLSTSISRSRENSVSSSSAASMIFTSSNDSSIDNGSNGRRFSSATTISSNMPSPKSPNHPRTPTLQDLLGEGAERDKMDGKAVKHGSRQDLALSGRHSKQGSTGSVEVVMYGVAR